MEVKSVVWITMNSKVSYYQTFGMFWKILIFVFVKIGFFGHSFQNINFSFYLNRDSICIRAAYLTRKWFLLVRQGFLEAVHYHLCKETTGRLFCLSVDNHYNSVESAPDLEETIYSERSCREVRHIRNMATCYLY